MLLNKKIFLGVFFSLSLFFLSCGEKKEKTSAPVKEFNEAAVLNNAKEILGNDVKAIYRGLFNNNAGEIAAVSEISTKDTWGIKFSLLAQENNGLKKIFDTELLEGSFQNSAINKLKLPSFDYELLYYNSLDYFIGSGGGEVFSYVIDFKLKQVYYAHLIIEGKQISLFLSGNIADDEVKNFLINIFRNDYPSLKIIDEDIRLAG